MLWLNGTNDFAYPPDSWQKSYRQPKGPRTLCMRLRMIHGHGPPGENPEEIRAFADAILKDGKPLARITDQGRDGQRAWATFESPTPIAKAELLFTKDDGPWQKRAWEAVPAEVDRDGKRVTAQVPPGATADYLNLIDDRGLIVSTEHDSPTRRP